MANIPNRAEYGNLACLWGVFKSRFTTAGDTLELSKLKHSESFDINAVDICPGRQPFPLHVVEAIGRTHYCPFLESRTDPRICQWVHSEEHDPQKSKPVGQTAIMLDILGLCDLITTESGRIRQIKWTNDAETVSHYSWGSRKLNTYFINRIKSYGPIIAVAFYLSKFSSLVFSNNALYDKLKIAPTNEPVQTVCNNGTRTIIQVWDGNTSNDAVIRSTASLLSLSASIGIIKPHDYPSSHSLTPSSYSNWLIQRAKNNLKTFPRKWVIKSQKINDFFSNSSIVHKGISYDNFIPKATDRNRGNRCQCCNDNVLNNARTQFGYKSKNRKLLLIEALTKAYESNSKVNLKRLAQVSLSDDDFYISQTTQYQTLLNIEIFNVALFGCLSILENNLLKPIVNCSVNAFNPIPSRLRHRVNELLSEPDIFVER